MYGETQNWPEKCDTLHTQVVKQSGFEYPEHQHLLQSAAVLDSVATNGTVAVLPILLKRQQEKDSASCTSKCMQIW